MPESQKHFGQPVSQMNERASDVNGHPLRNLILASIPEEEIHLLRPHIRFVHLEQGHNLYNAGEKINFGYFPNDGLVSLVVTTMEGSTVEVGVVGREGFVGLPLLVGFDRSPHRALIQVPPGEGFLIASNALEDILPKTKVLDARLHRYSYVQGLIVAQIAACNRLHEVDQRLARWLLMSYDRLQINLIILTQEFMAQMLGASRPTVSLAAGILQRAAAIQYVRGKVTILDRQRLEKAACECYGVIRNLDKDLGL